MICPRGRAFPLRALALESQEVVLRLTGLRTHPYSLGTDGFPSRDTGVPSAFHTRHQQRTQKATGAAY